MAVGDGTSERSAGDIESARVHAMAYEYLCHLEEARLWMQACLREAEEKEREEAGLAPPPITPEDRIMSHLGVKVNPFQTRCRFGAGPQGLNLAREEPLAGSFHFTSLWRDVLCAILIARLAHCRRLPIAPNLKVGSGCERLRPT